MPPPWIPRFVLATPSPLGWAEEAAIVARAEASGAEVMRLHSDRLTQLPDAYRDAKWTLAVVTASPSRRRLAVLPWAEGCPAHCSYCCLAGSLTRPPIVRAYADPDEELGPSGQAGAYRVELYDRYQHDCRAGRCGSEPDGRWLP